MTPELAIKVGLWFIVGLVLGIIVRLVRERR